MAQEGKARNETTPEEDPEDELEEASGEEKEPERTPEGEPEDPSVDTPKARLGNEPKETSAPGDPTVRAIHERARDRFAAEASVLARRANGWSLGRLLSFLAAVIFGIAAAVQSSYAMGLVGATAAAAFVILIFVHARTLGEKELLEIREQIHRRHLDRLGTGWLSFQRNGAERLDKSHSYAFDIDLLGPGSLFHRFDVTQTVDGEATLARWLSGPADEATIAARQAAVLELVDKPEFRQELEAAAAVARGKDKLDPKPFLAFTQHESYLKKHPYLRILMYLLPATTLGLYVVGELGMVWPFAWLGALVVQVLVSLATARPAHEAFDLIAARRGYAEAFYRMLLVVEEESFESDELTRIQKALHTGGDPPSVLMKRLDRWAGLADFRTQVIVYIFVNWLVLWDLHVLAGLERWNDKIGGSLGHLFTALGEIEALSSLAGIKALDPSATMPTIGRAPEGFRGEAINHPLLPADARVENDVVLSGPRSALIITGSNMAGKSTLLRAVGLNIALALAGGPVMARALRTPVVRLRASMRANDDLQRGASYFHAELQKLRGVVVDADDSPPIFFLLDELLRGTNAHARHIGARSVLTHLLDRGALGLVATHDIALSALEQERTDEVQNAHFTDVVIDGEMTFDYRLQPGVVRTSNALRLLKMAGIDVPDDDSTGYREASA
ncbi:MAG: hypothetical protein AAGF12_05420 [Myxococcota bacterium]